MRARAREFVCEIVGGWVRECIRYYEGMWREAVEAGAEVVGITSYNEWGEGTQVSETEGGVGVGGDLRESE